MSGTVSPESQPASPRQIIIDLDEQCIAYGRWQISFQRILWTGLFAWVAWLISLFFAPLLVPIRPLKDTVDPRNLADEDSRFIDIKGLTVHYKQQGQGEPCMVLLHGFGASLFSWREVMTPLSELGTVIAYDRPGFGLTDRPVVEEGGPNVYRVAAQAQLVTDLLDALGVEKAVLIGNSMGGSVALATAQAHPERVQALVLVDAAVYLSESIPAWVSAVSRYMPATRLGPLITRYLVRYRLGEQLLYRSFHDTFKVTRHVWEGYMRPFQVHNWDQALWSSLQYHHGEGMLRRLDRIQMPVLILTGESDRVIPARQSLRLAERIPHAQLVVIPQCGHLPHEERPDEFMAVAGKFLREVG
jgi:pimeloyl-ACP methyl ester carboxylesterase